MKPNIFNYATKELSQDAFIAWLLEWANEEYKYNEPLNKAGIELVNLFTKNDESIGIIKTVKVFLQVNKIDILVIVNDEIYIVIEDKTYSSEHNDQLNRYKEFVNNNVKIKKPIFVYLKIGAITTFEKDKAISSGYNIVEKHEILEVLKKVHTDNDILNDFKDFINKKVEAYKQKFTKNMLKHINIERHKNRENIEGFFTKLQSITEKEAIFGYTPNVYYFNFYYKSFEKGQKILLSIHNDPLNLFVYVEGNNDLLTLNNYYNYLEIIAVNNNISISKPKRFVSGNNSKLAIVNDVFPENDDHEIDLNLLEVKFKKLYSILDNFTKLKYEIDD